MFWQPAAGPIMRWEVRATSFKPVKPDRLLKDGDTIRLDDMQVMMLHHPGHTKGSCSFLFTVKDDQRILQGADRQPADDCYRKAI